MFNFHIGLDQPACYAIKIQGRLNDSYSQQNDLTDWFQGPVEITVETGAKSGAEGEAVTCLTGTIIDQAALHGLLNRIRDLGLTLLYVDCLTAHADEDDCLTARADETGI